MPKRTSNGDKAERIAKDADRQRQELAKHERYGNILYEKVNKGHTYAGYYNRTWKLKTGKTLAEYKYGAWQNMRLSRTDEAPYLNDTSKFATRKKGSTIKPLEANVNNKTNMEDEPKVETPVEEEATPEPEAEAEQQA